MNHDGAKSTSSSQWCYCSAVANAIGVKLYKARKPLFHNSFSFFIKSSFQFFPIGNLEGTTPFQTNLNKKFVILRITL